MQPISEKDLEECAEKFKELSQKKDVKLFLSISAALLNRVDELEIITQIDGVKMQLSLLPESKNY